MFNFEDPIKVVETKQQNLDHDKILINNWCDSNFYSILFSNIL